ncbi:MAG: right-handed parallel beta-helix repeat-containing protein [Victivallaceae bacterium]|nr:right-handed parallel beta-helix repeat-containing protein [Victivallaceae bacterium]
MFSKISIIWILCGLLTYNAVFAEDYFVRPPLSGGYGAGNGTTYTDAWNGWSNINWGSMGGGDTLYICGDHVYSTYCFIKQSGSESAGFFTIRGDYSTEAGSIKNTNYSGLYIRERHHVRLLNLTIKESAQTGLQIDYDPVNPSAETHHIMIDNVYSRDNQGNGFMINTWQQRTYKLHDIVFRNCIAYHNRLNGFRIGGRSQDIILENCEADSNNVGGSSWGFLLKGRSLELKANSTPDNWHLSTTTDTYYYEIPSSELMVEDVIFANLDYGFLTLGTQSWELTAGQFFYNADNHRLYVHLGGLSPNNYPVFFVYGWASGISAYNCKAYNTIRPVGDYDGNGMGFEMGASNSIIYGCSSYNNAGPGIGAMVNRNCTVAYSRVYNNAVMGISARLAEGNLYYNNVSYSNRRGFVFNDQAKSIVMNNNLAYLNTYDGFKQSDSTVSINSDYNTAYSNGTLAFNGITLGDNDETTAPAYSGNVCLDTGIDLGWLYDFSGSPISSSTPHRGSEEKGLIARYTFENDSNDVSLNNLDGTMYSNPIYDLAAEQGLFSMLFSGTNSQYVGVPFNTKLQVRNAITVSAFVKRADSATWRWVVDRTAYGLMTAKSTNAATFEIKTSDGGYKTLSSEYALIPGKWYHLAGTYDSASKVMKIYVNGQLKTSQTITASNPLIHPGNSLDLFIGRNVYGNCYFTGNIDDVRIYDSAFDAKEILYLSSPNLMARYDFEDSSSNLDSTIAGLDGAYLGNAASDGLDAQVGNRSLTLDGSGDYADTGNAVHNSPKAITLSCWAKVNTRSVQQAAIAKSGSYALYATESSGKPRFSITIGTTVYSLTATESISANEWHHIAGTYDAAAGEMRLYVDGTMYSYDFFLSHHTLDENQNIIEIGTALNGQLDDVRIYNSALSSDAISTLPGN